MAGSATFAVTAVTNDLSVKTLTINWTGDATNGGVPAYSSDDINVSWGSGGGTQPLTSLIKGHYGLVARIIPGTTTAPNGGALTLDDTAGFDFLKNAVTALQTKANINIQNNDPLYSAVSINITGNTTPSATGTIEIKLLWAGTARWVLQ